MDVVQQRAAKILKRQQEAEQKRQAVLNSSKEQHTAQRNQSNFNIDQMEYNWKDQPPIHSFFHGKHLFILPKETYHRSDEHLILATETYADKDGTIHTGPSGGQFVITPENQMGLVQLVSTEGAPIEDTVYIAFAMHLNKCPHAVLLLSEWEELEKENRKLYFPVQLKIISKRNLCPKTEAEKNGFTTFMMGPSSKEYNNHVLFQQLRYNIPKIFDALLEKHNKKELWDDTRDSCVLHLGFSGGTNQQSQAAFTTTLDITAITAKPEMNGKQDGSMEDFHRMIGPVLSLLSNTASIYLKKEDGGPILNDPNLEEDFAKVFGERCGCPSDPDDDLKNLFHALSVVLQEVGTLVTEDGQELDMDEGDITSDFVRQHCKVSFHFERMKKHVDGKNMDVPGFQHTGMFSLLLVKGKKVYRLTNIAYTRDICYQWILKNRIQ
jgi:hypothetical protein